MTTILPSAAQRAVSLLDQANINLIRAGQQHASLVKRILSAKDESGKLITLEQVQSAAGPRYGALPTLLAARDGILAFAPSAPAPTPVPASAAISQTGAAPAAPVAAPAAATAASPAA